jgi:invasion protein IalB
MTTNIKQAIFVIIGLAIISTVFIITKPSSVEASKQEGKKFDDWVVSCSKADEKTKTPQVCFLTQQVNITKEDKQEVVAIYQIGYFGPNKELKMIQTVPLGIRIEAGTSIVSSKNLVAPGKYTTCTNLGCQAVATISDADLKTILGTKEANLVFMNLDGQQIPLPLSTKGLQEGLKYIK